ncbi:MAG TPA: tetratricopeptide repeat protein, partial [Gemmataceae bacterium]|nr:tetratricopeptide repeat protein [Gemmataceae bacterium]
LTVLKKMLALAPDDDLTLRRASLLSLQLRKYEDAERYARRARAQNPGNTVAYLTGAEALAMKGQDRDALALCRQVLELEPTLGYAHLLMACCYRQLGDLARADEAIERARAAGKQDIERSLDELNLRRVP